MNLPEVHVIVTAPGHYFQHRHGVPDTEGVDADDLFGDTRVVGPFASRTLACEYADSNLTGQSWRVDSITPPAVAA